MQQMTRIFLHAFVFFFVLALPCTAMAKKPDHAEKMHKGKKSMVLDSAHGKADKTAGVNISVSFDDSSRSTIRSYLRDTHRSNCPPGLAKKNNNCQPPGQAKKYVVGEVVPAGFQIVPDALLHRLGPPPAGAFYAMVDKDVLLISEAGHKILDAVTLLSALD